MDNLILEQHEVHNRMARTYDNLKKGGLDKITLGRVQSTIQLLDKKWSQIEQQHAKLRAEFWSELRKNDYYTKDFMSAAEETYLSQRGKLVDMERSLTTKSDAGRRSVEGPTQLSPQRRTALPKIKLPEFSGKYEDWPAFRDLFKSGYRQRQVSAADREAALSSLLRAGRGSDHDTKPADNRREL